MPNSQETHSGTDAASQTTNPASAGKHAKTEEKKSRLLHILPKLPSTDSLSNSPGPSSPGTQINVAFEDPLFTDIFAGIASIVDVSSVDKVITEFFRYPSEMFVIWAVQDQIRYFVNPFDMLANSVIYFYF